MIYNDNRITVATGLNISGCDVVGLLAGIASNNLKYLTKDGIIVLKTKLMKPTKILMTTGVLNHYIEAEK